VTGVQGSTGNVAPRLATDAATTMDVSKPPDGVLEGEWEGAAAFGGLQLDFTFRVRKEGDRLVGTVTLPAQGLRDSPVDHLLHHGNQVHFEHGAGPGLALVDGTLDGDVFSGTLRRTPFVLAITSYRAGSTAAKTAAAARAAAKAAAAKTEAPGAPAGAFVGEWRGSVSLPTGGLEVRLHVASDTSATIDIPAQGLRAGALERVARDGSKVSFSLPSPIGTAAFAGTIDGETLTGTLVQNGTALPFQLSRVAGK